MKYYTKKENLTKHNEFMLIIYSSNTKHILYIKTVYEHLQVQHIQYPIRLLKLTTHA